MRIPHIVLVATLATFALSGCANNKKEVMVQSSDTTEKRVHTQEELRKTGQTETGAALEKVDPSVRVEHH
jgi:hypothetical protein